MDSKMLFTLLAGWLALTGGAPADEVRTRVSFNAGWRFERCGPMPDGSSRPEPGAAGWAIAVTASSQEVERGHGVCRWSAGGP